MVINARRAALRDANEPSIVRALEAVGCTVHRLNEKDAPDLLVGFRGANYLLEVKVPFASGTGQRRKDTRLKPGQEAWHERWRGQVAVVRTPEEALRLIGAKT